MGWLYMQTLRGQAGPREYLDDQYTFEDPVASVRVLRSALVGMRTYYAAVEQTKIPSGERTVSAVVCLVRYNPRDREGYIFGYKDMSEEMGPNEARCPAAVLDLLTATGSTNAKDWRERCRANLALAKQRAAKPKPRPGQSVVFDEPIRFKDGRMFGRLDVAAYSRSRRTVIFRDPEFGGLYGIPNLRARDYEVVGTPRE